MEDEIIKKEMEEGTGFPARALVALHDSVQNMSQKHKSALQAAVLEVSPMKKPPVELVESYPYSSPVKLGDGPIRDTPYFTYTGTRTMKDLLSSLNNSLKQSASRKWAYFEYFYSNIDRALLLQENDFELCLQHLFKDLKTRMLTKQQWTMIRRKMGKPRRCSLAFFTQERKSLKEKRDKIRYLHQLKSYEVTNMFQFRDLPDEIPIPMVVGTKVTAKVHPKSDGLRLFTGTIDAIDNTNNTYRINFESDGVGAHSVLDVEVASEKYESMNLQLFMVKERPRQQLIQQLEESSVVSGSEERGNSPVRLRLTEAIHNNISGTYGGFPINFLLVMSKLPKLLALKKEYVGQLKAMNNKVELCQPFKEDLSKEFKGKYAFVVLELEKINKELNDTFDDTQEYLNHLAPDVFNNDQSREFKLEGDKTAAQLIEQSHRVVKNQQMKNLVVKLTSLMLHINQCTENNVGVHELNSLDAAVKEIKSGLHQGNVAYFEDYIETSIEYLKTGLIEGVNGALSAFDGHPMKTFMNSGLLAEEEVNDDGESFMLLDLSP